MGGPQTVVKVSPGQRSLVPLAEEERSPERSHSVHCTPTLTVGDRLCAVSNEAFGPRHLWDWCFEAEVGNAPNLALTA